MNILHANSNILMSCGLKALLMRGGGIEKIRNCSNENELWDSLDEESFDLIIIDPFSSENFTLKGTLDLREKRPNQKILIISETNQSEKVLNVLEKGIQGFLTKQCDEDEITHAVFAIAKGEKFYCNKVLDIILNKQFSKEEEDCAATMLTERENEITTLVASGLTNKEIGEKLCLSHHTVHTHRKNILKKLGVKSVSELTLYAINVGLIQP